LYLTFLMASYADGLESDYRLKSVADTQEGAWYNAKNGKRPGSTSKTSLTPAYRQTDGIKWGQARALQSQQHAN